MSNAIRPSKGVVVLLIALFAILIGCGGNGDGGGSGVSNSSSGVTSPVAVTLDADGNNSNDTVENGIVQNLGVITSLGAVTNGKGGDIRLDGLDASLNVGPAAGSVYLQGSGTGLDGSFLSE